MIDRFEACITAGCRYGGLQLLVVLSVVGVLLCSCHQKELVYPASTMIKVSVSFDWQYAPEAHPDGMSVVFFPTDNTGSIWRYELAGGEGGDVEIPAGNYRVLAFNNDTKNILYSGTSHMASYNAYTVEASRISWPATVLDRFPDIALGKTFRSPDHLYCGVADNVSVELCAVSYEPSRPEHDATVPQQQHCPRHVIKLFPGPRTSNYTCIMRNVTNIDGFRRGYFVLSGLAPSELIAYDILSQAQGEYMFFASPDNADISGHTVAFGDSAASASTNYLYFVAVMADGSVASYRYDVSEAIVNSPDKRNVVIVIDGLELPSTEPVNPDDPDFDVEVNDWETVITDIIVSLK